VDAAPLQHELLTLDLPGGFEYNQQQLAFQKLHDVQQVDHRKMSKCWW